MDTGLLLILTIIDLLGVDGEGIIPRTEGAMNVIIPCPLNGLYRTVPFWKINDTTYYFLDVPHPFRSMNGRYIEILTVDLSLNGTSLQCFIVSLSGEQLIRNFIGVLRITESRSSANNSQMINYQQQEKLVLDHQRFLFTLDLVTLAWKTLKNEAYIHYQLIESSCASNSKMLVNNIKNESISLPSENLIDERNTSKHLNLSSFDEENNTLSILENFRLEPGIITKDIYICLASHLESITSVPSCVSVPQVNGQKTLVLALPFVLVDNATEKDLLCPIHPLPGERCVDLPTCNRFSESAYANSITICRTTDDSLNLKMCFHNITERMNGTKVHFFYSDPLYCSDHEAPKSRRTYIRSLQLITKSVLVDLPNHTISNTIRMCFDSSSSCYQDDKTVFSILLKDKFGCVAYQSNSTMMNGCIPFSMIPMACASLYHLEVKTHSKIIIYRGPLMQIPGFIDAPTIYSSMCPCYKLNQSTMVSVADRFENTQTLAIATCAIIALVIILLLIAIAIVTYRNFK